MIRFFASALALLVVARGSDAELDTIVDANFTGPLVPITPALAQMSNERAPTNEPAVGNTRIVRAPVDCQEAGPDGRVSLRFGRAATPPTAENPFDCRLRESSQSEQRVRVGLVVLGRRALAIVNGQTLGEGMRIAGFNVVAIEPQAVVLERNGQCFRVRAGTEVRVSEETTR
ncbi:general secretion pathway protein GspB [Nibricoccus sp. IMCC34717]|uniref:general secretion pathway protein GspB n=1 Tax=Nibricoccus sp. IMCC34717 TaxID=3034021 RepID=UPI00384AF814